MAYLTNPNLPRVRMDAVRLVRSGWSTRKVARHLGFNHSSIVRWAHKAPDDLRLKTIPTLSYPPRPMAEKPGILTQIDTIFDGPVDNRLYVYTLIDVCSRWAHALVVSRINTHKSLFFVKQAKDIAPFEFQTIQSDHGSEFSKWFTKRILENGLSHRHSRVRMPSDNGHLERFNRTLQDEIFMSPKFGLTCNVDELNGILNLWLTEYLTIRPHDSLNLLSPFQFLSNLSTIYSSRTISLL